MDIIHQQTFLNYSRFASEFKEDQLILENGVRVEIWGRGIIYLAPAKRALEQQAFIFSSGIHGDETAPMEIASDLLQSLLTQQITLKSTVLFIFGNLPAINQGVRQVEYNLNRLFTSESLPVQSQEHERALELKKAVRVFIEQRVQHGYCLHLDMHTAIRSSLYPHFAVHPFTLGRCLSQKQVLLMLSGGLQALVFSNQVTHTFSCFTATTFGIDALTVELGQVAPWGENDLTQFERWRDLLISYLSGKSMDVATHIEQLQCYQVVRTIVKSSAQLRLAFPDDLANFTAFMRNDVLAVDMDQTHLVQQDGEVILFPNANVAIGQRVMLIAQPVPYAQLASQLSHRF